MNRISVLVEMISQFVSGTTNVKLNFKYLQDILFEAFSYLFLSFFVLQDYIRSVQFHPTEPWIISASDDKTAKIWEYKTGRCLLTLTGHENYVMCAKFHPTLPLVATASLDHTVRIWDISSLCFFL